MTHQTQDLPGRDGERQTTHLTYQGEIEEGTTHFGREFRVVIIHKFNPLKL